MKSKTSFFNKTIFKKNITHFWPIWVLILLWNLFILPFMIFNESQRYKIYSYTAEELARARVNDLGGLIAVYINPVVIFIFCVITVMAVFSYLYNTKAANAFHAFPVTRKELFVTNYVSGLLFLLVPQFVGFLSGTLVGAICGFTNMDYLLKGLLLAWGISLFFYSFTVLIAMFTGQLFAVPVFSVVINMLYIGCYGMVNLLTSMISYGITPGFDETYVDFLSPLYYVTRQVSVDFDYSGEFTVCKGITGASTVACYALASIVFIVAAFLVYKKRNMETCGNLISIPAISPVFRWGMAFCAGILLGMVFGSVVNLSSASGEFACVLISSIVFGAVFFFAAQMFLDKSFRVFRKKRFIECGAFLLILSVLLISIECDLFGQEKKIPDVSEVEWAIVDGSYAFGGCESGIIENVVDVHRQVIDSKKEFESAEGKGKDTSYMSVRYLLKDGSALSRVYQIPANVEMVDDTATVLGKTAQISMTQDVFLQNMFGINYKEMELRAATIDLYDDQGEQSDHEFTKDETQKLYQAMLADLSEGNFKNHMRNRMDEEARIDSSYFNSISFEYYCKEGNISLYDKYYNNDSMASKVGWVSVEFDANCKNIIKALVETGAIESEDDLIIISEKTKLDEKNGMEESYPDY